MKYIYEQWGFRCELAFEVGQKMHMHNQIELMYFYGGRVKGYHNFQEYEIKSGDFYLVFPNTLHTYRPIEEPACALIIFDKSAFPQFSHIFNHKTIVGSPVMPAKSLPTEALFCLDQILSRVELQSSNPKTYGYLMVILDCLLETYNLDDSKKENDFDFIKSIIMYINDNFTEKISLDSISQNVGISKYHISRTFNSLIGTSITEYLTGLRVEQAMEYLKTTEHSITDIAYSCGFESSTSFYRSFKNISGVSPKNYRKNTSKNIVVR